MAQNIATPARCTDPDRFKPIVRRMLAVPLTASEEQFRQALRGVGGETLCWYENRIRAIKDTALRIVIPLATEGAAQENKGGVGTLQSGFCDR